MHAELARRLSLLVLALAPATVAAVEAGSPAPAQATLPLDEVLRLVREGEAARRPPPAAPPTGAAVQRVELQGRLLDAGMALEAHFEVAVLADDAWIEVPLLRPDEALSIPALPVVDNATLTAEGGALRLLTRRAGRYAFDLSLHKRAQVQGARRSATILLHQAAPAVLRLRHDPAVFEVQGPGWQREADGLLLHARGDRLDVTWQRRGPAAAEVPALREVPVEPVVTQAMASVVSTLAGRPVTRVRLDLRFSGTPEIAVQVPAGLELHKVFVNGQRVPFAVVDGTARLQVQHARAGDESASLELVLLGEAAAFNLAGHLHLAFPVPSWTVNEYYAVAHLPAVFDYTWRGGSLAPVDSAPAVDFSERLPEPGKVVRAHQFLVAGSAPTLDVDYAIALEGQFFTGR